MIRAYRLDVLIGHFEVDTASPVPWERDKVGKPHVKNKLAFILFFETRQTTRPKIGRVTYVNVKYYVLFT